MNNVSFLFIQTSQRKSLIHCLHFSNSSAQKLTTGFWTTFTDITIDFFTANEHFPGLWIYCLHLLDSQHFLLKVQDLLHLLHSYSFSDHLRILQSLFFIYTNCEVSIIYLERFEMSNDLENFTFQLLKIPDILQGTMQAFGMVPQDPGTEMASPLLCFSQHLEGHITSL